MCKRNCFNAIIIVVCLLFIPIHSIIAADSWSDSFDQFPGDWEFFSYSRQGASYGPLNYINYSIPDGFINENGILSSPYVEGDFAKDCNSSYAFHNSNQNYIYYL